MKTAWIFPGLNGLLRRGDRNKYLHLPEVKQRFRQAESALRSNLNLEVDLDQLLASSTEEIYALGNISLAAVAICAIQTGVADRLLREVPAPDWVMGCSLGDLARAVLAGAYEFDHAVVNHVRFTTDLEGVDKIGRNIGVLAPKGQSFSQEDFLWFDEIAVDVSRLTPRFLNVGGRFADLELVEARAEAKGWSCMTILNYPAHSRYILPYVEKVGFDLYEVQTRAPTIPIFSSFSCKPLTDPTEIKQEFVLSITRTIHWHTAVEKLNREHGVTHFVNVGPCKSLSTLMRDIPVTVSVSEADSILQSNSILATS